MARLRGLGRSLAVGFVLAVAGGAAAPAAEGAFGQFDYARVKRLDRQTGALTVEYGLSGLRDSTVAVSPSMRATALYRCKPAEKPAADPADTETTVSAFIFRPEDVRGTVAQPDGTRAAEGQLTVVPPPAPTDFCPGGKVRLRAVTYDDPQVVATLNDDVSGLGSRKITGRLGFRVEQIFDEE